MRRATYDAELYTPYALISIHALLAESDEFERYSDEIFFRISIHALLAESDSATIVTGPTMPISIHALLAESDYYMQWDITDTVISIHALLAESDADVVPVQDRRQNFYPRSPCGERPLPWPGTPKPRLFLSTLSLRRATRSNSTKLPSGGHFYPRSPCGERHGRHRFFCGALQFLSTLSLRRATLIFTARHMAVRVFLSTLSLRRATAHFARQIHKVGISIHALLAESDHFDTLSALAPK